METRPGAAGNVGAEFVAKAPADGYTLLMALGTTFTVNPSLYKKPPFDPLADFRFIAIMASDQQHAGRASVHSGQFGGRIRRLREEAAHFLCAWWQRQPRPSVHGIFPPHGRLPGDAGALSRQPAAGDRSRGWPDQVRLRGDLRRGAARPRGSIERPCDGDPQALSARAGAADDGGESAIPNSNSMATTSWRRRRAFRNRSPHCWSAKCCSALASPELQEKFRAQDILIAPTPGAETKARIKSDLEKWAKVVKAAGMRVD